MNFEQPPPYPGSGPTAPCYPAQGPPPQGYPPQGYPPQGYPVNMEQPNPAYPNYPVGPPGPGGPYPVQGMPPYQGYPEQQQYGWQGGPPPGTMYGEAPKNTVYVVEDRRREGSSGETCLTACWTALCCCCLWDMLT
ncbi:cysteine-rich and transmembrane domain-containing protein 1 [Cynoglossus semilaevis]|uniref:Cysteine-rich and transmembrane domain-containing protein 1 n=1 Tax=Cynoglossus semilaevis TaxID=244447 RepID=A0A3P8WQW0_CYNSE|nr:cysteine-rich and transmembrane domain-containing protein 1-like [Cynoglossus semilaevis]XP_008325836.1 cysteine-rich and transmembrane domain-containing protein 1-like [Cynoglossus semilaevis]